MRAQVGELFVRFAWTYTTGLGVVEISKVGLIPGAWAELRDPARAARDYAARGRPLREAAPKEFQSRLAGDIFFLHSIWTTERDADGRVTVKRPFVPEQRRPGRPRNGAREMSVDERVSGSG